MLFIVIILDAGDIIFSDLSKSLSKWPNSEFCTFLDSTSLLKLWPRLLGEDFKDGPRTLVDIFRARKYLSKDSAAY